MTIPNATEEQLASQARINARAAAILAGRKRTVHTLLASRPELADLATPGVVLADAARWSA